MLFQGVKTIFFIKSIKRKNILWQKNINLQNRKIYIIVEIDYFRVLFYYDIHFLTPLAFAFAFITNAAFAPE